MAEPPSPATARFLQHTLESVRQLEVLLRLRAAPERAWTPHEVSEDLRSSAGWAAQQLEDLRDKHLVGLAEGAGGEPAYRYAPATSELSSVVDAAADLFERRKATVIALIFGDAKEDPVQSLSDAFRIRRRR